MSRKSTKERVRARRKRQRIKSNFIWAGWGVAVLALLGVLIWPSFKPAAGDTFAIMPNAGDHIALDSSPVTYNTEPPTSGPHFASPLNAGFYDESDLEQIGPNSAGFLLHDMEHGYVIIWYNCELLDESECSDLKGEIQLVLDDADNFKVIAFPRSEIDVPIVMTSWGRMQAFESFDIDAASNFVSRNRSRAPEPQAQ